MTQTLDLPPVPFTDGDYRWRVRQIDDRYPDWFELILEKHKPMWMAPNKWKRVAARRFFYGRMDLANGERAAAREVIESVTLARRGNDIAGIYSAKQV